MDVGNGTGGCRVANFGFRSIETNERLDYKHSYHRPLYNNNINEISLFILIPSISMDEREETLN